MRSGYERLVSRPFVCGVGVAYKVARNGRSMCKARKTVTCRSPADNRTEVAEAVGDS